VKGTRTLFFVWLAFLVATLSYTVVIGALDK
jgi:hypothetical protein